jgi:hypothetical protein
MARARNIKPGFFRNEILLEMPLQHRLSFIGLWCLANRDGRLEDRPKRIKLEITPFDAFDMDAILDDLAANEFITRYQAAGIKVIQIVNFHRHQNPHSTEKDGVMPDQDGKFTVNKRGKNNSITGESYLANSPITVKNPSTNALIPDSLIPDSKPIRSKNPSEHAVDGFADFWVQYPKKVAKPAAAKAWSKVKPTGQTLTELMAGLVRQKASPEWNKDGGQFIPHAATWINGRRWEDEPTSTGSQSSLPWPANSLFAGAV